ncbi:MAG: VanW family protein [Clostridium sp.]|uniref:VanW family protein n=1 Tax=Clostridium sp. TaxID=1506 RepID=UPI003D6DA63B
MKKKVTAIILIILLIVVLGVGAFYGYMYNKTKNWTSLVYPGVNIGDVDISGKTLTEAKDMINAKNQTAISKKNINIKTPSKTYTLNFAKMNAGYNIDEVVNEAFNYGKDLSLRERYKLIKNPVSKLLNLKFTYDPKPVTQLISEIKKDVDTTPVNGSISRSNGKFNITSDKKGYTLMDNNLKKEVLSKINGDITTPDILVEAEIKTVLANVTKEKLQTINTTLSSFSSSFKTSSSGRSTNITLATKSINGLLLMPGESFSFNGTVGKRTAASGYKPAPVDIGTKVSTDYGGGICQVSTALYNTVIRSNIKSTERNHHSIPSTYIPLGMDATVDWNNLDYKFANTLNYPIYIESIVSNKVLTFNIYSNSSLNSRAYKFVNDVYEAVQPGPTKYIDDPSLLVGQIVQDQFPLVGYKVRSYLDTIENGNVIKHELISNDKYTLKAEVIRLGTKKN